MFRVLGWTRIIAMAIGILNFTICAVRDEFESFPLGQTTTPVHSFLLGIEVLGCPVCVWPLRIPTPSVRIRNNVYFFPHSSMGLDCE